MKKFIPLVLVGLVLTLINCRQSDEMENSLPLNTNNSNVKSITTNNSTILNDSIMISANTIVEENIPPVDKDKW